VLLTMGGVPWRAPQPSQCFSRHPEIRFAIPGGEGIFEPAPNLVLLPHHSSIYHPDLVGACDAVVGKLGYSTVAEVFRAGIPLGYVLRDGFPESPWLASFVAGSMRGLPVTALEVESGTWVERVEELLGLERPVRGPKSLPPNDRCRVAHTASTQLPDHEDVVAGPGTPENHVLGQPLQPRSPAAGDGAGEVADFILGALGR
jgi:hypothetical protein